MEVAQVELAPHTSCFHKGYALTCSEYEDLRAITPGCCHWCGRRTRLEIDHDHAVGPWAVRGLLCRSCNHCIQLVECGKRARTESADRYLTGAWHLRQASSAAKKSRAMPRGNCPVCGLNCAVRKNGELGTHWCRLPGSAGKTCPGRIDRPEADEVPLQASHAPTPLAE